MIHVVIMAGGSGTRFWPASRKAHPKQFLTIAGDESMLAQTAKRVLPLCGWERLYTVASPIHSRSIKKILPLIPKKNLLVEPIPKNTAPAIGLASVLINEKDPEAIITVLPADHVIHPAGRFRKLLRAAHRVAKTGAIVTLGVKPSRAETGYGYIHAMSPGAKDPLAKVGVMDVFKVKRFVEKPDLATAKRYLKSGKYYWNSGMFVFSTKAILGAFERHMPSLHEGLMKIVDAPAKSRKTIMTKVFEDLESISIDYGVMEKASSIRMLPCDVFWSDVGCWDALAEVEKADAGGNVVSGDTLLIDSKGCVVQAKSRMVACVGCDDMVVVETKDAILVCPVDKAQDVRKIVAALRKSHRDDIL